MFSLLQFLVIWAGSGVIFSLLYFFVYHKNLNEWVDYQVYVYKDKEKYNNLYNSFKLIQNTCLHERAFVVYLVASMFIPAFPIGLIILDHKNYPKKEKK